MSQEHRQTIAEALSWVDVVDALGLSAPSDIALLRGHVARLRIEASPVASSSTVVADTQLRPTLDHLNRARPLLAAAWFMTCGCDVSWPLEPNRYDLLVTDGRGCSTRTGEDYVDPFG